MHKYICNWAYHIWNFVKNFFLSAFLPLRHSVNRFSCANENFFFWKIFVIFFLVFLKLRKSAKMLGKAKPSKFCYISVSDISLLHQHRLHPELSLTQRCPGQWMRQTESSNNVRTRDFRATVFPHSLNFIIIYYSQKVSLQIHKATCNSQQFSETQNSPGQRWASVLAMENLYSCP